MTALPSPDLLMPPIRRQAEEHEFLLSVASEVVKAFPIDIAKAALIEIAHGWKHIAKNEAPLHLRLDDILKMVLSRQPGLFLWWVNKTLYDPLVRRRVAAFVASKIPPASVSASNFNSLSQELETEGIVTLPALLHHDKVAALGKFLNSRTELVKEGPTFLNTVTDVVNAPHALEAAMNPDVLSIVSAYLGASPTLVHIGAWRSIPMSGNETFSPHIFHRDTDDFRACKLFLYLTDVDTEDGPHVFVKRSHDPNAVAAQLVARGHPPEWINDLFIGSGRQVAKHIPKIFGPMVIEVHGKAGTAFLEITYGFHRGKMPTQKNRLVLEAVYGTTAFPNRLERFEPVKLNSWPEGVADTTQNRHALRLLM